MLTYLVAVNGQHQAEGVSPVRLRLVVEGVVLDPASRRNQFILLIGELVKLLHG